MEPQAPRVLILNLDGSDPIALELAELYKRRWDGHPPKTDLVVALYPDPHAETYSARVVSREEAQTSSAVESFTELDELFTAPPPKLSPGGHAV